MAIIGSSWGQMAILQRKCLGLRAEWLEERIACMDFALVLGLYYD